MKTILTLAVASLFLVTLAPTGSAEVIPDPCEPGGIIYEMPRGPETCDDIDYVIEHWTTQTVLSLAQRAAAIAFCLSEADPYNWAPSDYMACLKAREVA